MVFTPDPRSDLTQTGLANLLEHLGTDSDTAAREYEAIRLTLVDFFEFRRAPSPDLLADETINRIARKLSEGAVVDNVRRYVYGVAKRVWLEAEKQRAREQAATRELGRQETARFPSNVPDIEERIGCLQRCLARLPEDARELIVAYYQGAGRSHLAARKVLAERLGISYVSLKTRAHRIRTQLEVCLRGCPENPVTIERSVPSLGKGADRR
jgi:DNA-directed RNA polymerase specialized sigma24 family protein